MSRNLLEILGQRPKTGEMITPLSSLQDIRKRELRWDELIHGVAIEEIQQMLETYLQKKLSMHLIKMLGFSHDNWNISIPDSLE